MDIIYIIGKSLTQETTDVVMYMSLLLVFIVMYEKIGETYTKMKKKETMNYLQDRVEESTGKMDELQQQVLKIYFQRQMKTTEKEDQGFFRVLQSYLLVVYIMGNHILLTSLGGEMTLAIGLVLVLVGLAVEITVVDNKLKKVKIRFTTKMNET